MKKILLFILMLFIYNSVSAVELGDIITKDGIPCIVIYIDASGTQALVMSQPALSESYVSQIKNRYSKKKLEVGCDRIEAWIAGIKEVEYNISAPTILYPKKKELDKKVDWTSALSMTSGNGEENTKAIYQYCDDNNIPMDIYFPAFHWCSQLGKDWFIPGNDDLKLYAEYTFGGLGIDHRREYIKEKAADEILLNKAIKGGDQDDIASAIEKNRKHMFLPICIFSSTAINSTWSEENITNEKILQAYLKNHDFYTLAAMPYYTSHYLALTWCDASIIRDVCAFAYIDLQ